MIIKVLLDDDEIRKIGFRQAMELKWKLEDLLDDYVLSDAECLEVMNEIQKKKKF